MRQKPPVEVFDAPTDVSGVSRDLSCKPGKEATRLGGRADPVSEMPVSRPLPCGHPRTGSSTDGPGGAHRFAFRMSTAAPLSRFLA